MSYQPFDKKTASVVDRIAWALCQIIDDDAPMRWTRYRFAAECIAKNPEVMADLIQLSGTRQAQAQGSEAAHVQAGEGADVQRLRAVVVRNGAMVYPHLEDDASGNLVTYSDYAALRARIAELETEIRAKDRAGQMALDKLAELSEQLKAAEARNAASERDAVLVPREATSKMMDRAVAAMHAAPVDWRGRQGHAAFRAGYAAALDAAIDAHAQGQAGEEKDG